MKKHITKKSVSINLDKLRDILTVKLKDLFSQRTQLDPILLAIARDRQLITENINMGAAPGF
jgi:hypothetical protein